LKCGAMKPYSEYHAKRGKPQPQCKACRSEYMRGHYLRNKARVNAQNKAWYEANRSAVCEKMRLDRLANPEKFILGRRLNKYGLTKNRYEEMLKKQGNKCQLCQRDFTDTPHIDHCHDTGIVRALMCGSCNTGFGLLQEDVAIFKRCIAHARKYKK
jgi:hypothetical protein